MWMGNHDSRFAFIWWFAETRYGRQRYRLTQRHIQRAAEVKNQAAFSGKQFDTVSADLARAAMDT
jgi:hypothetical protein